MIGRPVDHSLSPVMHNAAFEALGLRWKYLALSVPHGHAADAIEVMRTVPFAGMSVTMPHKTAVAAPRRLVHADRDRPRRGELRVVAGRGAGRRQHRRRWASSMRCARTRGTTPPGAAAVVLGGGGAARAVVARAGRRRRPRGGGREPHGGARPGDRRAGRGGRTGRHRRRGRRRRPDRQRHRPSAWAPRVTCRSMPSGSEAGQLVVDLDLRAGHDGAGRRGPGTRRGRGERAGHAHPPGRARLPALDG